MVRIGIGSFDDKINAVVGKYDRKRLEKIKARKELTFSLEGLHPFNYVGKVDGGRFDPPPLKPSPTRDELLELVHAITESLEAATELDGHLALVTLCR